MPRTKKFRFTPRRVIISSFPSVTSLKAKSPPPPPPQMEAVPPPTHPVLPSTELLPKLCCVVCYNEYPYYSLNCAPWEGALTSDFYVALNIPQDESVAGLPFCPECHSKVAVMFSLHQQLQNVLQNFNCVRNDLAFTVVDSFGRNCRKGPLDLIREQIHARWKGLYDKAKEVRSSDVYDPESTLAYLKPQLSVADEFPADPSTMTISGGARARLGQLRRTPVTLMGKGREPRPQTGNQGTTKQNGKVTGSPVGGATGTRGKNSLGMPKLEPMGKIGVKSPSTTKPGPGGPSRRGGLGFGQSRIGQGTRKLGGFKAKAPPRSGSQSNGFQLTNHFKPNSAYHKKAPKRLGNLWKCNYCPATYPNSVSVSQHESRAHPDTRPYLCNLCSKGFLTLDGIRKHLQSNHPEVVEGYVKCPHCPRHFARKIGFRNHISTMHKGKKVPDFDKELQIANAAAQGAAAAAGNVKSAGKKNVKVEVKVRQVTGRRQSMGGRRKKVVEVEEEVKVDTVPVPMVSPPSPEITDLAKVSSGSSSPKRRSPSGAGASVPRTRTTPGTRSGILGKRTRSSLPPPRATPEKQDQKEMKDESPKQEEILTNGDGRLSVSPKKKKMEEKGPEETETETLKKGTETETTRKLGDDENNSNGDGGEEKVMDVGEKESESKTESKAKEEEEEGVATRRRRRTGVAPASTPSTPMTTPTPSRKGKVGTRSDEVLTCNICGKTFNSPWALGGHSKAHRGRKFASLGKKAAAASTPTKPEVEEGGEEGLVNGGVGVGVSPGVKEVEENGTEKLVPTAAGVNEEGPFVPEEKAEVKVGGGEEQEKAEVEVGGVVDGRSGNDRKPTPPSGTTAVIHLMIP